MRSTRLLAQLGVSLVLAGLTSFASAAQSASCAVPLAMPGALLSARDAGAGRVDDEIARAESLASEGRMREARAALERLFAAGAELPRERAALGESMLALAAISEGDLATTRSAIQRARSLAPGLPPRIAATVRLNLAAALAEVGDVTQTRNELELAAAAALASREDALRASALVRRALLEARIGADPLEAARAARAVVARLEAPALRARLGVALGLALLPEKRASPASPNLVEARDILAAAYADASAARRPQEVAEALGLLGELQLAQREPRQAFATFERAIAVSRTVEDDPWRFRWLWKRGVALRELGEKAPALASFQDAVVELEGAKARRSLGRFSASTLARDYRRAYYDLADALLGNPGNQPSATLKRVLAVMEQSRSAEIEDFFRDPCLASRSKRVLDPEALDASAALIHPLLFDDRIEILVSHSTGVSRFTFAKDAAGVAREVQRLRNAVERPGSDRYRDNAMRLHSWLVAPIEAHLAKLQVRTLVWIPDGPLRGLPFAALHDGRTHLVERYAIAIAPVAQLIDPQPAAVAGTRAWLSGLTRGAQGFEPLPGVATELAALGPLLGVRAVRDEQFSVEALRESLRRSPVNIVHIASHGQFSPMAEETFLLANDGRLTLPQLRAALAAGKLREEPLELLVLSACQTAAGDDKAALGLAGVAIGAGARSALATLWAVSDDSTTLLTTGFYRALLSRKSSRAQALRESQLALLRDERYEHPFYWAPYVLIGNWM